MRTVGARRVAEPMQRGPTRIAAGGAEDSFDHGQLADGIGCALLVASLRLGLG